MSIFEKGDNLETLANKCREWFIEKNIEIPKTAREWQSMGAVFATTLKEVDDIVRSRMKVQE